LKKKLLVYLTNIQLWIYLTSRSLLY